MGGNCFAGLPLYVFKCGGFYRMLFDDVCVLFVVIV